MARFKATKKGGSIMNGKKLIVVMAVSLLGVLLMAGVAPGEDYPVKDIRHIIPWSAGGGTDTAMRGFMHYAEKYLPVVKKPVAIYSENVTGAQSGIGVFELMRSRPDGYTIGTLTWDSVITVPYYNLVPGYDLEKLEFICTVTVHPTSLVVRQDAPWQSLEDFIRDAKKRPGEISVSNVGIGGVWHLPALDMERKLGIELRHIPYPKGAGPQREALIAGETDAASISLAAALPALKAGQARVLAIMAEERDPLVPEAPTFKELGYEVVWGSFRVVAVPRETPEERVKILEKTFEEAFQDEKFQEWAEKAGLGAVWKNREQTKRFVSTMQQAAFKLIDELVKAGILKI